MCVGLWLLVIAKYFGVNADDSSYVIKISSKNHDETFHSNKYLLVKFCNQNLRSCRETDSSYRETALKAAFEKLPITFAKVDCGEEPELCQRHSVSNQPVSKFYNRGKVDLVRYGLKVHQKSLYEDLKQLISSKLVVLRTPKDFVRFLETDRLCVVGFFTAKCELKNVFKQVADELRNDFDFAFTTFSNVTAKAGYSHGIVLYYPKYLSNKYEDSEVKYDGKSNNKDFKAFLLEKAVGLVGVRTKANLHLFTRKPLFITYFNVDFVDNSQESHYWRKRILKVASKYKTKAYFAVSDEATFDQELEEFGLKKNGERLISGEEKPVVGAFTDQGRYRMETDLGIANLSAFVESVLHENIKVFTKSEYEMAIDNDGFVKVVVNANFNRIVLSSFYNVFLMLFSPTCGICRGLSVKLDEVCQLFSNANIIFAKMDIVANDIPPLFKEVTENNPNLYWLSKNKKEKPISYNKNYQKDDIIQFIRQNLNNNARGVTFREVTDSLQHSIEI